MIYRRVINLCVPLIAVSLIFSACKKNVKNGDNGKPNGEENAIGHEGIEKRFLKEGFITKDKFRVVIVATKDETCDDIEGVRSKAQSRALATLRKYIISENLKYDKNVEAQLRNLIMKEGNFNKQDIEHQKCDVFYYDIDRTNLEHHLKKISSPRKY